MVYWVNTFSVQNWQPEINPWNQHKSGGENQLHKAAFGLACMHLTTCVPKITCTITNKKLKFH